MEPEKLRSTEWAKKYGYKSMIHCLRIVFSKYPRPTFYLRQSDWATYYHGKQMEYVLEKHGRVAMEELKLVRQPDGKNSVRFTWMKLIQTMKDKNIITETLLMNDGTTRGDNGHLAKRLKGIPIGLPHGKIEKEEKSYAKKNRRQLVKGRHHGRSIQSDPRVGTSTKTDHGFRGVCGSSRG